MNLKPLVQVIRSRKHLRLITRAERSASKATVTRIDKFRPDPNKPGNYIHPSFGKSVTKEQRDAEGQRVGKWVREQVLSGKPRESPQKPPTTRKEIREAMDKRARQQLGLERTTERRYR